MEYLSGLRRFFASVKLTVVLLLSLAATSIIGTIIPQKESPAAYLGEYGEFLYTVFSLFDFFDMYHSWWFQFLVLLLAINVVVCSLDRLSVTWKMTFVKIPSFNLSWFRSLPYREEFADNRSPEHLERIYEPFVSRGFGYSRVEHTDKGFCIFAEKWRWTRLGVYAVHLSAILLLIGALIGSVFGFEGYVNIPEGEAANSIRLRNTGGLHNLDFEIRCDDFNVTFYGSGTPKEYRSSLTILEQGERVLKKDIIVNAPLRYKGINIFQSSYGTVAPKEITLNFTSKETGMPYRKKTTMGDQFDIPEGMGKFVVKDYMDSYNFRGHSIGETLIGVLTPNNRDPIDVILPLRFPSFDKMRNGDLVISVAGYKNRYFTGLQVTRDPGVPVVYSGFVVMIIGFLITFLMSHQRLCIEVIRSGKKSRVMVAGTANKNKMGMQNRIKKISQGLADLG